MREGKQIPEEEQEDFTSYKRELQFNTAQNKGTADFQSNDETQRVMRQEIKIATALLKNCSIFTGSVEYQVIFF